MSDFLEALSGNNSLTDNHGNVLIYGNEAVTLRCNTGQTRALEQGDENVRLLEAVGALTQHDIGYDVQRINLGDLSSPLQAICDDLEPSPQR